MIASWYTTATTSKAKATSPVAAGTEMIQGATDYTKEFLYFNSPESGARYTKEWFKVVPVIICSRANTMTGMSIGTTPMEMVTCMRMKSGRSRAKSMPLMNMAAILPA